MNKKRNKILLISISFIFLSLTLIYYSLFHSKEIFCSEFSTEYYKWFPYSKNDVLIFIDKKNDTLKYKVSQYESFHTKSYESLGRCGHCEDYLVVKLSNQNDTLNISFHNLDYSKSLFGSYITIRDTTIEFTENKIDSIFTENKINLDKYLIEKNSGLISITIEEDIWKLYKTENSNSKKTLTHISCE